MSQPTRRGDERAQSKDTVSPRHWASGDQLLTPRSVVCRQQRLQVLGLKSAFAVKFRFTFKPEIGFVIKTGADIKSIIERILDLAPALFMSAASRGEDCGAKKPAALLRRPVTRGQTSM